MADTNAKDPKNPLENAAENLTENMGEQVPDGSGSDDHSDPRAAEVHSNLAQGLNADDEVFTEKNDGR